MEVRGGWVGNGAVAHSYASHLPNNSLCLSLSCTEPSSTAHGQVIPLDRGMVAQAAPVNPSSIAMPCEGECP